jgi:hypothetical protein
MVTLRVLPFTDNATDFRRALGRFYVVSTNLAFVIMDEPTANVDMATNDGV